MKRRAIMLALLAGISFSILFIPVLCPQSEAGTVESPVRAKPALGELDLRTPAGEQVSLIPYIGRKVVVVAFWATWCPICRAETVHLNKLNSDPRVKVVAVNGGESIKQIQAFVTGNKVGYEVVTDPKAAVAKSFGVPGMPYCVIIGRSGVISYRGVGLPENLETYLSE
jgi:peroxiredoxin